MSVRAPLRLLVEPLVDAFGLMAGAALADETGEEDAADEVLEDAYQQLSAAWGSSPYLRQSDPAAVAVWNVLDGMYYLAAAGLSEEAGDELHADLLLDHADRELTEAVKVLQSVLSAGLCGAASPAVSGLWRTLQRRGDRRWVAGLVADDSCDCGVCAMLATSRPNN